MKTEKEQQIEQRKAAALQARAILDIAGISFIAVTEKSGISIHTVRKILSEDERYFTSDDSDSRLQRIFDAVQQLVIEKRDTLDKCLHDVRELSNPLNVE